MLLQSIYGTQERRPEKSAGALQLCGQIALIFLDFFVLLYQDKRTYICDCIDRNGNKSSNTFSYKQEHDSPLMIEATPNPATHYVEFTYELSEIDKEGIIIITDMNGKQIQSFNISYQKGKQAWDTRKIPSGSYIYTLQTQFFEKSGKLIIQ